MVIVRDALMNQSNEEICTREEAVKKAILFSVREMKRATTTALLEKNLAIRVKNLKIVPPS